MKKIIALSFVLACAVQARAATTYDNSEVINVSVSTTSRVYTQTIDLRGANTASWQMDFTCATGSATIAEGNDGANFVSLNVAGSSLTVNGVSLQTLSNQLYSQNPVPYAWAQFNVTNSSAPANPAAGSPCTLKVFQALKSDTITGN